MADVLIYADTVRSPELRREIPLSVGDPFLYAERNGTRHALVHALEASRMGGLGLQLHAPEAYGADELVAQGLDRHEADLELVTRAVRDWGIESARVPVTFPLEVADRLRRSGVELATDRELFDRRRRVKSEAELAGIRRAQRAAEAGMAAARDLLGRARVERDAVLLEGEPLTSERLKAAIEAELVAKGTTAEEFIVAHGWQAASGHHAGEGAIEPGESIVIDLWPRDRETACFADMTRTFVVGDAPAELVEWHRLVREALDASLRAIRAGVVGRAVYDAACEVFEREGHPTSRTKEPGQVLEDGFFHGLGHGVGLEVHEAPGMGRASTLELVAGDVVTVEPGLYRKGYGGVRLEDLVLVTEEGYESLTDFPYDLEPRA